MNLDQKARWQHVVLFASLVGLLSGGMILAIGLKGAGTSRAPPMWAGPAVLVASVVVGALAIASLRAVAANDATRRRLAGGAFALPTPINERVARLNARIATHFGLRGDASGNSTMPTTFAALVDAVNDRARDEAALRPGQHRAARASLAAALDVAPDAIAFGASPIGLFPRGRERSARWDRLRVAAPTLPPTTLNPWIENVAIYAFLAGLIAIAVPIAQRLDADPASSVRPTTAATLVGKGLALVLFGGILSVLMIPVYMIGRRFAARLPAGVDSMGALARHFPRDDPADAWTAPTIAEHTASLVAVEWGIATSEVRADMRIA